jgi:adenosine deaminase
MLLRFRSVLVLALAVTTLAAPAARNRSVEQLFTELKKSPPELYAFLLRMPKGADLHNHLSGAAYAESFLDRAAAEPLCVSQSLSLVRQAGSECGQGQTGGAELPKNNGLANRVIDTLSMRDFVPGKYESPADHFFDAFGKFAPASHIDEGGEVAEVAERAAEQNESYLELMALNASGQISALGAQAGLDENNFDATRQKLLDAGLESRIKPLQDNLDNLEQGRMQHLACNSERAMPGCAVTVHYVFQVLRESPKEQVFAQTLAGFMLAAADPRVVAVNFVQREDGYNSMHDYALDMRIVAYARKLFPKVHVSLHAGELANGLVPPEGLRFHVRDAVTVAGAERIGHGVDIAYEKDSLDTLRLMRERHIDVEINLTSNDVILGVKGQDHPFPLYRKYGVPVTLSTDDEGVSRSHLTVEYQRAVLTYGLSYADIKQLASNSIEYSFAAPTEKTRMKTDLEKRFRDFEAWALANFR